MTENLPNSSDEQAKLGKFYLEQNGCQKCPRTSVACSGNEARRQTDESKSRHGLFSNGRSTKGTRILGGNYCG